MLLVVIGVLAWFHKPVCRKLQRKMMPRYKTLEETLESTKTTELEELKPRKKIFWPEQLYPYKKKKEMGMQLDVFFNIFNGLNTL